MVICRTPYRISFFGGGTDYPSWYRLNGGAVLATSIDKYCYLTVRYLPPFFDHRYRIVYSRTELCKEISEIEHPAVRSIIGHLNFDRGLEIHHDGDLPSRSGVGSSSSFVVGLLNALYALRGQLRSKRELTMESIHIEQESMKESVGSQDQTMAAYGGLNMVRFLTTGEISVVPLPIPIPRMQELNRHFLLFFTGQQRTSSDLASSYAPTLASKEEQMRRYMSMVEEAVRIVQSPDSLDGFGHLLDEAWQIKRKLSSLISNESIDGIYSAAKSAGALGGKIIGAGGGGFILFFVPPAAQQSVRSALRGLLEIPFKFESHGSQIIFIDREADYASVEFQRGEKQIAGLQKVGARPFLSNPGT